MSKPMKVLVAYDGSPCANEAIADLKRAGLPDDVEALVLSVADLWILPQGEIEAPPPLRPSTIARQARAATQQMLESAKLHATEGAQRIRGMFPTWKVHEESAADSPAWAIVLKAEEWGADLIVVGSHGYSSLGRWVLGSVSQAVLTHANCSVRIARDRPTLPDRPLRILLGIDGSSEADLAAHTVATRLWPKGTDIRLMMVVNPTMMADLSDAIGPHTRAGAELIAAEEPFAEVEDLDSTIHHMLDSYLSIVDKNPGGATVSTTLVAGDPKRVLVEEAEKWGADSIFIGSRGLNRWERLLLGSVSSAVAVRAHCPVEIVRALPTKKE